MSGKSLFKKFQKKTAPRSLDEITQEYNTLRVKVADAQYQVYVYTVETENLNKRMYTLNQEASERQRLDAMQAAKLESPKDEAKNVTA